MLLYFRAPSNIHMYIFFLSILAQWEKTYFGNVVHQATPEHGVQLDLVVLQDVLEGTAGAILGEEATVRSRDAGANEANQMIVSHIFHLELRNRE